MLERLFAMALIIAAFYGAQCAEKPAIMFFDSVGVANVLQGHRLEKRQTAVGNCTVDDTTRFLETVSTSCRDAITGAATLNFTDANAVSTVYSAACQSSCINPIDQFNTGCGLGPNYSEELAVACSTDENGDPCYNILPLSVTLLPTIFTSCPSSSQIQQLEDFGCCANYIALDIFTDVIGQDVEPRFEECGFDPPSERCAVTTVDSAATGSTATPTGSTAGPTGSAAALQIYSYMVTVLLTVAAALMNF